MAPVPQFQGAQLMKIHYFSQGSDIIKMFLSSLGRLEYKHRYLLLHRYRLILHRYWLLNRYWPLHRYWLEDNDLSDTCCFNKFCYVDNFICAFHFSTFHCQISCQSKYRNRVKSFPFFLQTTTLLPSQELCNKPSQTYYG